MKLTAYDGNREGLLSGGKEVVDEIYDLIRARLPRLAADDPVRRSLSRVAPGLAEALDRPVVEIVREGA